MSNDNNAAWPYSEATPANFLGLSAEEADPRTARALVVPVPYEATVGWKGGTRNGPAAILAASRQVELYDEEFGCEPAAAYGAATLPATAPDTRGPEQMVARLEKAVAALARRAAGKGSKKTPAQEKRGPAKRVKETGGKFLLFLGGEHTIAAGIARGLKKVHRDLVVVQVDAHADLRAKYEGSPYNHACAMARIVDQGIPVVGVGIRNWSLEEARFLRRDGGRLYLLLSAEEVCAAADKSGEGKGRSEGPESAASWTGREYLEKLFAFVGDRPVYLTFDVDGLDPSIMPATGTPEPGGLSWREALVLVRELGRRSNLVAADFCELAPRHGLHAADFLVAKLAYKLLSYRLFS